MDLAGVPTPVMDWTSINLSEAFKKFRQHIELVFRGPLKDKDEDVQITYFLLWIGEKGREIHNTFQLTPDMRKSVKETLDAFQRHVQPKSNPVFARYKFNNETQGENTVEQYITRLKVLAQDCSFGEDYSDDMVRDRIVFGIKSQKIREKLLTIGAELTLAKAVQICQTYEYAHVNLVISSLPVSDRKLQEIRLCTEQDGQLSVLKNVIQDGWPVYRNLCPTEVIDFWNFRDELSVVDGLIMKGQKIVVPKALRSNMLEIVHAGHMGVEKTLRRARDVIFWPRISNDITNLVLSCATCLEYRSSNPKEPLQSHAIPDYPWQIVGTDLFSWENKEFIIVADYYSHYFEVKELPNMKSSSVINRMKGIFARMGIPQRVVSDNQTCYASEEFAAFANAWNFEHVTSSPHHSSGNGFSEAYVKICKRIFKKAKLSKTDPFVALLEYRTTPLDIGYTPSELLMGRKLRSIVPTAKQNLMPSHISPKVIKDKLQACRKNEKNNYDKNAKPLKPLELGGSARVQQQDKTWKPATVMDKLNDRSYVVQTSDGASYRRNRRHLLKTNECLPETPNVEVHEQDVNQHPCVEPLSNPAASPMSANTGQLNKHSPYTTRYGRVIKPRLIESM